MDSNESTPKNPPEVVATAPTLSPSALRLKALIKEKAANLHNDPTAQAILLLGDQLFKREQ